MKEYIILAERGTGGPQYSYSNVTGIFHSNVGLSTFKQYGKTMTIGTRFIIEISEVKK